MRPSALRATRWGRSFVAEPANADTSGTALVPRVLSIAGTDPTGGAGLFADLKSISAMGGYGMGAITSITAQNTTGVQGVYPQPVEVLRAQLESISADVAIDAVKIGMLGEADTVRTVAAWLESERPPLVVMDPVMVATTGGKLSTDDATVALVELARSVSIVTPNVPELGILAGEDTAPGIDDVVRQATKAHEELGVAVLATTGDLDDASHADILVTTSGGRAQYRRASLYTCRDPSHPRHGMLDVLRPRHGAGHQRGLATGLRPCAAMDGRRAPRRPGSGRRQGERASRPQLVPPRMTAGRATH